MPESFLRTAFWGEIGLLRGRGLGGPFLGVGAGFRLLLLCEAAGWNGSAKLLPQAWLSVRCLYLTVQGGILPFAASGLG